MSHERESKRWTSGGTRGGVDGAPSRLRDELTDTPAGVRALTPTRPTPTITRTLLPTIATGEVATPTDVEIVWMTAMLLENWRLDDFLNETCAQDAGAQDANAHRC